jgi:glucose/arabinose dehydrogenase
MTASIAIEQSISQEVAEAAEGSAALRSLRPFVRSGLVRTSLIGGLLFSFSAAAAADAVLPSVPPGFKVELFARDPLVRNPCAMAFDARGRLFVGQGPQYRNPKPDTPGDTIEIMIDSDGDGIADKAKTFAKGLNCVQGLAWHGRDLWVANAPRPHHRA